VITMKAGEREILVIFYKRRFFFLLPGEAIEFLEEPFQKRSIHLRKKEVDVIGRMKERERDYDLFHDFFRKAFHAISFFGGEKEEGFRKMILRETDRVFLRKDDKVHKDLRCVLGTIEKAREERRRIMFGED